MVFLVSLVAAALVVLLFRIPLQKVPFIFYVVALALVALYLYAYFYGVPILVWRYLLVSMQRCTLALAFFTIVMFIGVFPEKSKFRSALMPIRRQLSILGSILAFGHIIVYITSYIVRFASGFLEMSLNATASLSIALLLLVLLVMLLITSFTQVHKRMKHESWKRLQRLSYPFYLLIFVHIILILMPSVLAGSASITLNIAIYSTMFISYSILRIVKYLNSKRDTAIGEPDS